jgi:hypothetical protein
VWSKKDRENKHPLIGGVFVFPIFFAPLRRPQAAHAGARLPEIESHN